MLIAAGMAVLTSGIAMLGSGVAWHGNGQALIVAAVIASGVAVTGFGVEEIGTALVALRVHPLIHPAKTPQSRGKRKSHPRKPK